MSLKFYIPSPAAKTNFRTLSKGFGLPLVQRAIVEARNFNITTDPPDATSLLGTPVYDTLFIERPNYTTFEFNDFTNKYVQTASALDYNKPAGQAITNDTPDSTIGLFLNGVIIDATIVKNIIKIVVDSLNMQQQQGMRNVQYFQLNCSSTVDYTIAEKKNV
jgi:hypothetical protein